MKLRGLCSQDVCFTIVEFAMLFFTYKLLGSINSAIKMQELLHMTSWQYFVSCMLSFKSHGLHISWCRLDIFV